MIVEQLVFFILYTFSPENIKEWKNNFSINLIQDSVLCRSFETPSCHAISVSLSVQVSDQSWKERVFISIASNRITSNHITSQPSVNSVIHLISFHFIRPDDTPVLWQQQRSTAVLDRCMWESTRSTRTYFWGLIDWWSHVIALSYSSISFL